MSKKKYNKCPQCGGMIQWIDKNAYSCLNLCGWRVPKPPTAEEYFGALERHLQNPSRRAKAD